MKPHLPTIAFTVGLFNCADGPGYCVYTQSYGLEMTLDDEWPINTIIMAPPHLMPHMADVASMGALPGASYTPGDGEFGQIAENSGRWVLARRSDPITRILNAQLGVLLYINDVADLDSVLPNDRLNEYNLIIAFQHSSALGLDDARNEAGKIRMKLSATSAHAAQILVSTSFERFTPTELAGLPEVSGLLFLDADVGKVIDLLRAMAG